METLGDRGAYWRVIRPKLRSAVQSINRRVQPDFVLCQHLLIPVGDGTERPTMKRNAIYRVLHSRGRLNQNLCLISPYFAHWREIDLFFFFFFKIEYTSRVCDCLEESNAQVLRHSAGHKHLFNKYSHDHKFCQTRRHPCSKKMVKYISLRWGKKRGRQEKRK